MNKTQLKILSVAHVYGADERPDEVKQVHRMGTLVQFTQSRTIIVFNVNKHSVSSSAVRGRRATASVSRARCRLSSFSGKPEQTLSNNVQYSSARSLDEGRRFNALSKPF